MREARRVARRKRARPDRTPCPSKLGSLRRVALARATALRVLRNWGHYGGSRSPCPLVACPSKWRSLRPVALARAGSLPALARSRGDVA